MRLVREVYPFEQLGSFQSEEWDKVSKLVKFIIDNNKMRLFNAYAEVKFQRGVDEEGFRKWCCEKADTIIDYLNTHEIV